MIRYSLEELSCEGRPSLEHLFRLMRPSLEELSHKRHPSLEELHQRLSRYVRFCCTNLPIVEVDSLREMPIDGGATS